MVNESSQPKPGDAVLGGHNPPPIDAAVLGGIEGVKQRCASLDFQARIAGLQDAVKYGEPGIELLLHGLKDKVLKVGLLAYSLLQENVEPELKKLLEIYAPCRQKCAWTRYSIDFKSIAFSPNGQLLATGSSDKTIKLWDVETGTLMDTLYGHSAMVESVAFSPNGQLIASCSQDKTVKLWDAETGILKATLSGHSPSVRSVAFSPNGQLLAIRCYETIELWDVKTLAVKTTLSLISNTCVFNPNGQLLASGSGGTIKLWDVETGMLAATLTAYSSYGQKVSSLAFSPNGQVLASCSEDCTIKLWNVETLTDTLFWSPAGRIGEIIVALAFSPNGQLLASCGNHSTIRMWNVETGTHTITISTKHSGYATSVAFSPNGQLLAHCAREVKLWDVETEALTTTISKDHAEVYNLNIIDPIALFHSYLEIKQPKNSNLYETIQLLNSGTQVEREAVFSQLQSREEPVVKAVLWLYINARSPQVSDLYKPLNYFMALDRWQEAKEESEKILCLEYGHKEVMKMSTYYYNSIEPPDTLQCLHSLWQAYAVRSLIKGQKPLDFFAALNSRIKAAAEAADNRSDTFSRRCYHETHE